MGLEPEGVNMQGGRASEFGFGSGERARREVERVGLGERGRASGVVDGAKGLDEVRICCGSCGQMSCLRSLGVRCGCC